MSLVWWARNAQSPVGPSPHRTVSQWQTHDGRKIDCTYRSRGGAAVRGLIINSTSGQGQQVTSAARQRGENPVGSFGNAHFGQHVDVVPQSRIDGDQAIVFRKRLGEFMPSFLVQRVDFRPWRRKEY